MAVLVRNNKLKSFLRLIGLNILFFMHYDANEILINYHFILLIRAQFYVHKQIIFFNSL